MSANLVCRSQWGENQLGGTSTSDCKLIAAHATKILNLPYALACEPYKYMSKGWASQTLWINDVYSGSSASFYDKADKVQ